MSEMSLQHANNHTRTRAQKCSTTLTVRERRVKNKDQATQLEQWWKQNRGNIQSCCRWIERIPHTVGMEHRTDAQGNEGIFLFQKQFYNN